MNSLPKSPVNILCTNVRGLGQFKKNRYRLNGVPYKIKEMVSSCRHIPTIYFCLETKLKSFHRRIRLPKGMKYIGETSCDSGQGGIFGFMDNCYSIEDRKRDVKVIVSKHAMFVRVKIGNEYLNLVPVYLPSNREECNKILKKVSSFLDRNNITNFSMFGDTNCDFNQKRHNSRNILIQTFLEKYNMHDLATKLNIEPGYTWRGTKQRINSYSYIDHFYTNMDFFNFIEFSYNSFSDHKSMRIGNKKKFKYSAPKWQGYLFNNKDFINLMKEETSKFLIENADPISFKISSHNYSNNFGLIDNDFTYVSSEHQNSTVLFDLINHLKKAHDRFFSKLKFKSYNKTKEFDKQINLLYDMIDSNINCGQASKEINRLIQQQQEYFKMLVQTNSETFQMRALLLDGLPNNFTYKNFRNSKKQCSNLLVDNELIDCPKKIANIFGDLHAQLVCPNVMPNSNLDELLNFFDLKLDNMYPKIKHLTNPYSTTGEFRKVIKSMKSNSMPGPTSQPTQLFAFLLDNLPKFTTKAFNNMYDIDLDNSSLSFVKERNITYIPKPGLDPTIPGNRRPIAQMENVLKILDKAINKKVTPLLSKICHSDQYGFIPKRHMANATISIVSIINHIKAHNYNSQLIFFDLQRAYDKALHCVSNTIIKHIFPEGNFAKSWISLTNGGSFKIVVKGNSSKKYKNKIGFSQGAPSSGSLFDIYNHIFYCCLTSPKIKNLTLKLDGKPFDPIFFADDGFNAFQLKSNEDIQLVSNSLQKLESTVNIKINFQKTKIITHGECPLNISILGTKCDIVKHLGVYLSFNLTQAADYTYEQLFEKLNTKSKKFAFFCSDNVFKRRNITFSLMNTMAFHIFRIYAPNQKQIKKLWKITAKFLWSSKSNEGNNSYRYKVAKNRIEMDFSHGGLNMLLPSQQSFIIWFNAFLNLLKHAHLFPNSNIARLLSHKHVPISSIFDNLGSEIFHNYIKNFRTFYPLESGLMFRKAKGFLVLLEKHRETFLHSNITSSVWAKNVKFNNVDIMELNEHGLNTIASILDFIKIQHKVLYRPLLNSAIKENLTEKPVLLKLQKVVENMCSGFEFNNLICLTESKQKFVLKPIIKLFENSPRIYTFHFKKTNKELLQDQFVPPSFKTRKMDKKYNPEFEVFKNSFNKILSLPIVLYYKSFLFEQFNRTLISRSKLYEMKLLDNNLCLKCNVKADTDHSIMECYFPSYFTHCLALFLDNYYNDGKPDFIFLKENFYLFNIHFPVYQNDEYIQISILTLIAKDRSLKISKDEQILKFSDFNCFAQTMFIAQFASKILNNTGINSNLIDKFIDYLMLSKNNVHLFRIS